MTVDLGSIGVWRPAFQLDADLAYEVERLGYGVEIGLLLDTYDRLGIDAIGQVNLGVRTHRNRPLADLGVMSRQILGTVLGRSGVQDSGAALTQFPLIGDEFTAHSTEVSLADRPPMNTLRPSRVAA